MQRRASPRTKFTIELKELMNIADFDFFVVLVVEYDMREKRAVIGPTGADDPGTTVSAFGTC